MPTTNQRGYGWHDHQLPRQRLLYNHKDGTPCWWCGRPMFKDKTRNHDHKPLARDHIEAHGAKNRSTKERLLHYTCNSQRQDGSRDHQRPALRPTPQAKGNTNQFQWM